MAARLRRELSMTPAAILANRGELPESIEQVLFMPTNLGGMGTQDPLLQAPLLRCACLHSAIPAVRNRLARMNVDFRLHEQEWQEYKQDLERCGELGVFWDDAGCVHDGVDLGTLAQEDRAWRANPASHEAMSHADVIKWDQEEAGDRPRGATSIGEGEGEEKSYGYEPCFLVFLVQ